MPKRLSPEIPLILAVVAQFLAVGAVLWVDMASEGWACVLLGGEYRGGGGVGGAADVVRVVGADTWGTVALYMWAIAGIADSEVGGCGWGSTRWLASSIL